jgi:dTDP-glucose 4,6-dehydratase
VDDLVRGLIMMIDGNELGPVNLGNPVEATMIELADWILLLTGSNSPLEHLLLPVDDPTRRRPDISRARQVLGWQPEVELEAGLRQTIASFQARPDEVRQAASALAGIQSTVAGVIEPTGAAQVSAAAAFLR